MRMTHPSYKNPLLPIDITETVMHEYFHSLQYDLTGELSSDRLPRWMLEGSAFWIETKPFIWRGDKGYEDQKGWFIK